MLNLDLSKMHTIITLFLVLSVSFWNAAAQTLQFEGREFEIANTKASVTKINGKKALKLERDLGKLVFDATRLEATIWTIAGWGSRSRPPTVTTSSDLQKTQKR